MKQLPHYVCDCDTGAYELSKRKEEEVASQILHSSVSMLETRLWVFNLCLNIFRLPLNF